MDTLKEEKWRQGVLGVFLYWVICGVFGLHFTCVASYGKIKFWRSPALFFRNLSAAAERVYNVCLFSLVVKLGRHLERITRDILDCRSRRMEKIPTDYSNGYIKRQRSCRVTPARSSFRIEDFEYTSQKGGLTPSEDLVMRERT
jgi:hypothetical protein